MVCCSAVNETNLADSKKTKFTWRNSLRCQLSILQVGGFDRSLRYVGNATLNCTTSNDIGIKSRALAAGYDDESQTSKNRTESLMNIGINN